MVSWLDFSFLGLFGADLGGLLLVGAILRGEVTVVAVGLQPEDGWLDGGWVGGGPCLGVLLVVGEIGAELPEPRFFREVEVAQGEEGLDAERVGGVALGDAVSGPERFEGRGRQVDHWQRRGGR